MNELIRVLANISEHKSYFIAIDQEFEKFDNSLTDIGNLLSDKSKWAGNACDVCECINTLIQQYEQAIHPITESLCASLSDLTDYAGAFFVESANVRNIGRL